MRSKYHMSSSVHNAKSRSAWLKTTERGHSLCFQVDQDHQVSQSAEDDLQDEFIGFTDGTAGEEDDEVPARSGSSPKAAEEPSTSGRSELPWTRASHHIRSATIRLHNGVLLHLLSGLNSYIPPIQG